MTEFLCLSWFQQPIPHNCTSVPPTFFSFLPELDSSAASDLQSVSLLLQRFRLSDQMYPACVLSCYGAVQSLSGDAERDVAVEAVGQGDCSLYSEDTITDEEGRFRLRGLLVRGAHSLVTK